MTGYTVLIIDDDPELVEMVTELLSVEGYRVMSASSAPAGVELALRERPDLIVTDLFMPGMDGATAVRMLKAAEATRNIPIVAVTGATGTDVDYILAAGCANYVPKPAAPRILSRVIARLLG